MWYLTSCLLVVINHAIQIATFWQDDAFGTKCYETLPGVGNMLGICQGVHRMLSF